MRYATFRCYKLPASLAERRWYAARWGGCAPTTRQQRPAVTGISSELLVDESRGVDACRRQAQVGGWYDPEPSRSSTASALRGSRLAVMRSRAWVRCKVPETYSMMQSAAAPCDPSALPQPGADQANYSCCCETVVVERARARKSMVHEEKTVHTAVRLSAGAQPWSRRCRRPATTRRLRQSTLPYTSS